MKIKGFDKDLKCRGMQFEVGKEYKIELNGRELELCTDTCFHYCDSLQQVHEFYSVLENNRFCEIEVLGEEISDGEKCGSNHIKIVREIVGEELNILKGITNGNTGIFNSGSCNSGNGNSGNCNSGSYNSGNGNSGLFNSCNFSSGIFCSIEPKINIFNMPTNMTMSEFLDSRYYRAITSSDFNLTEWIPYTEEEMEKDKSKKLIGGYLKTYTYQEACRNWWNGMSSENKAIICSMPNFDANVFKEITGIEVKICG